LGRDFDDDDDRAGGPNVAIISDRLLQRRFGGDRSLVGRRVMLNDREYLVIGVMPPRFANVALPSVDIWAPLQDRTQAPFNSREWGHHYQVIGRLAAGETVSRGTRGWPTSGGPPLRNSRARRWRALRGACWTRIRQREGFGAGRR